MGIFDRFLGENDDEETFPEAILKRHISLDVLDKMSDDDLREAFFSLSTGVERLLSTGTELRDEMQLRELSVPEDSTLMRAISAVETRKSDDSGGSEEPEDEPTLAEKAADLAENEDDLVPGTGGSGANIAFVSANPSIVDTIRKNPLSGPTGHVFNELYLKDAMGMSREDVLLTHLVPTYKEDEDGNEVPPTEEEIEKWAPHLEHELEENEIDYIVALGKTAADALGERADEFVPHPEAVRKQGDSGEVSRKLGRLLEKMEEQIVEKSYETDILKFDEELQEVTSVVMEPDEVDTDGDWTTKEEIHDAMVFYMENSQQTKIQHQQKTENVRIVETWQTRSDMTIGGEKVKAGAWLATAKVHDEGIWKAVKSGELTGFSIGARARYRRN